MNSGNSKKVMGQVEHDIQYAVDYRRGVRNIQVTRGGNL